MRTITILVLLGFSLIISGCYVRSLQPLYRYQDVVFDSTLVGTWIDDDSTTWSFRESRSNSYELIYYEPEYDLSNGESVPGDSVEFVVHLVSLDNSLFMDLFPGEVPVTSRVRNLLYQLHLIQVHTFAKVWLKGDSLSISMFDPEWLEKLIYKEGDVISYERIYDDNVLSASTPDLQEFVLKFADDPEVFAEPLELLRQK